MLEITIANYITLNRISIHRPVQEHLDNILASTAMPSNIMSALLLLVPKTPCSVPPMETFNSLTWLLIRWVAKFVRIELNSQSIPNNKLYSCAYTCNITFIQDCKCQSKMCFVGAWILYTTNSYGVVAHWELSGHMQNVYEQCLVQRSVNFCL